MVAFPKINLFMKTTFWIKRALLVLALSFTIITGAQYLKTKDLSYAMIQAAIWGTVSTLTYLGVLWRKLRKNPDCAIKSETERG